MAFYKSISEHYDDIFPLNQMQVDFVKSIMGKSANLRVLDVGCGTGSLSIAIAPHFKEVIGIDPDESMLELAIEKSAEHHPNISFYPYGMLDLDKYDKFKDVDAVLCFGNTLVHLDSADEISQFLEQAKKILKPAGKLLIQIINYERIFAKKVSGLPTIENDRIKFVRHYHYDNSESIVEFETILTLKKTGEEIRNQIPLLPIRKNKLEDMLIQAGFENIKFYGNFKRDAYHSDSIPLILEASFI